MDAELVTQIIHILIYDDFLFLDFNYNQIVSIHLNDIYKIS